MVVLVLLVSLSLMTLGTVSDTGLQFQMVRNDQFHTSAYLSAYSEINAQLGRINANDTADVDGTVLELLAYDVEEPRALAAEELAGAGGGAFGQEVAFALTCDPDHCPSPPGHTMGEITKVMRARIDSRSDMAVSGAVSDQSQTFWYLLPQTDVVTFE